MAKTTAELFGAQGAEMMGNKKKANQKMVSIQDKQKSLLQMLGIGPPDVHGHNNPIHSRSASVLSHFSSKKTLQN